MPTPQNLYRTYATHTLLYAFGRSLFGSYGTLLLYAQTQSVGWAIGFWVAVHGIGIFVRSYGMVHLWGTLRRVGVPAFMGAGIIFMALGNLLIWAIVPGTPTFLATFFGAALLFTLGSSMYWVPSSAILYSTVGMMKHSGSSSAMLAIARNVAAILAAGVGLLLSTYGSFSLLIPLSSVVVLVSVLPLRHLHFPVEEQLHFLRSLRALPHTTVFANLLIDTSLKATGVPLIILLLPLTLEKSAWAQGLTVIGATVAAYVAGKLEDRNNHVISVVALVVSLVAWGSFALASTATMFIVAGVIYAFSMTVIDVDAEARLCREVAHTGHSLEESVAIETIRTTGAFIANALLLCAFLLAGTLPQLILLLGALFFLPQGIYALGGVAERARLRRRGERLPSIHECERHSHAMSNIHGGYR